MPDYDGDVIGFRANPEMMRILRESFNKEIKTTISLGAPPGFREFLTKYVKLSNLYVSRSEFIRVAIINQIKQDMAILGFMDTVEKTELEVPKPRVDTVEEYLKSNGQRIIKGLEF